MQHKHSLVKWQRNPPTIYYSIISDGTHFDEVHGNNLLGLFSFCIYMKRIEWHEDGGKLGERDG